MKMNCMTWKTQVLPYSEISWQWVDEEMNEWDVYDPNKRKQQVLDKIE